MKKLAIRAFLFFFAMTSSLLIDSAQSQQLSPNDWKLGIQMWSFHLNTFEEALNKTQSVGIKYIEGFPGQKIGGGIDGVMDFHMDTQKQNQVKKMLNDHGIKMVSFGVVTAPKNEDWLPLFEFAKSMGLDNIAIEPDPDQIIIVSKLADQYKIHVAIHNHPRPSLYWDPNIVMEALRGASPYMGFCADIGHWLESDIDPVGVLEQMKGHIIEFHLKDENRRGIVGNIAHPIYDKNGKMDQMASLIEGMRLVAASGIVIVPLGAGVINMPGIMQVMKEQNFKGYLFIEHEHNFANNVDEVKQGAQWFNKQKEQMFK